MSNIKLKKITIAAAASFVLNICKKPDQGRPTTIYTKSAMHSCCLLKDDFGFARYIPDQRPPGTPMRMNIHGTNTMAHRFKFMLHALCMKQRSEQIDRVYTYIVILLQSSNIRCIRHIYYKSSARKVAEM